MTTPDPEPPRSSGLPPGHDENDIYSGEDVDMYPEWWRKNIEEFRDHSMRPYRPPRFSDGELVPPLIAELEDELDVRIVFRTVNPKGDDDWDIVVDGSQVTSIERHREGGGYSQYFIESRKFEELVRDAVP